MNNSTKTALAIIEQRENENNEPAFALWVEIYNGVTAFDLTPYLRSDTKGEADLTVSLGSYTFIKVKAESITKQEGEIE